MNEPLKYLLEKYGADTQNIEKIIYGAIYTAVLLKNGNTGICATLSNNVDTKIKNLKYPDLDNIKHRIVLNAYYNALLNYSNKYDKVVDIFDGVNFKNYDNIVMIGLFESLFKKFKRENINVSAFDMIKKNNNIISIDKEGKYVGNADAIIISATTIFNKTFMNIVNNTKDDCDIFLLGPSSVMSKDIFKYRNIKTVFGTIFKKNDVELLNIINKGFGTKRILPFGKKVSL
jgi:uncharacterized protein (DUF4213/DUF364 family)